MSDGVYELSLTPEEATDMLENGTVVVFEMDGAFIERDPEFHILVEDERE